MYRRAVGAAVATAGLGGCLTRGSEGPRAGTEFTPSAVETVFVERFNKMRTERGVPTVTDNDELSAMGQAHAENMAKHEYVGHEQPDGTTPEQRFADRGLRCELPVAGSDSYYPAAENAAGAAEGDVTHPGTEKTFHINTNDDLAAFLMDSWMTSDGHRRVMVLPAVREIGLGVAQNGDDIYAALEFC
jgi:uncharacterized protein YkwD